MAKPFANYEVIFNDHFKSIFDESVTPLLLEGDVPIEPETKLNPKENSPNSLACSHCQVKFLDVQQQREHYRLDWHRYNLKQSLQSKPFIKEEDFNKKTENDDVSSISGSDSEEDQETLSNLATAQGKLFLQNQKGQVISMYRAIFSHNKKEELASVNFYQKYRDFCQTNQQWAVLMLGGGHFAGAIFNNFTPVVHKSVHCYTVRAGQGGSQSSRDGKSGGSHPKSAGASLRRYNEQALIDHVHNIVDVWKDELKKCSLIFYRGSGPYNRGVLFGGKEPLLDRNDERLRTIPFSTGRATYTEVKRVHLELCSARVFESFQDALGGLPRQSPEKDSKRNKTRSSCINRAKSREIIERPLPTTTKEISSESSEDEHVLESDILEVSFEDLQEFGDSLTPEQRKIGQRKKKPKKSKNQKLREKDSLRKQKLINTLIQGNTIILEEQFQERFKTFNETTSPRSDIAQEFFNEILDDDGNSFLHLAAMNEHEDVLKYLLENEADPCVKNKKQQTPYSCSNSKVSRDVFRNFARDNPNKFNYNKANIPVNALTEDELAEKKRAQRKVKREKDKEKKKENVAKQKELEQKDRFLHLSDREKRALAAERRILNAHGKVIARCFLCGADMAGKVPFEYLENRFCSIDCLKGHRMKNALSIS